MGYVGLHEQALASEYFNYLMQDEVTFESTTEMMTMNNAPFDKIYSRLSKNASKNQRETPKLNSNPPSQGKQS